MSIFADDIKIYWSDMVRGMTLFKLPAFEGSNERLQRHDWKNLQHLIQKYHIRIHQDFLKQEYNDGDATRAFKNVIGGLVPTIIRQSIDGLDEIGVPDSAEIVNVTQHLIINQFKRLVDSISTHFNPKAYTLTVFCHGVTIAIYNVQKHENEKIKPTTWHEACRYCC